MGTSSATLTSSAADRNRSTDRAMKTITRLALLAAMLLMTACEGSGSNPNAPEVLALSVSAPSAPADGTTVLQITGFVDPDTRGDRRQLTFSVSGGVLTEGDGKTVAVTADEDGAAQVGLRAPTDPGVARIRLTVGSITRQDSVLFTRAVPDAITVEPERFAIAAGLQNEIRVTVQLRRALGRVSPGTPVAFRAFRAGTTIEVGRFGVPSLSDANGVVTVRYTPGDTSYRGPVRIVAIFTGEGGGPVVIGDAYVEIIG